MIRVRAATTAISTFGLVLGVGIEPRAFGAPGDCHHVVLYDCCEDSLGNPTSDEWRLFDPQREGR